MERGEPTLVPEWYKGASSSANPNHHTGSSSHSDEHNSGLSSRNRLSVNACDHDASRSSAKADRSSLSSFGRSAISNGSIHHDKDTSSQSRPYSSFGRSHRDRDRDRNRDRDRDREKDLFLLDDRFCDYSDSFTTSRIEKNTLRRSHSMISGRQVESWSKRPGSDLSNGVLSGGSIASGISKASFERDFPSLGAEEKQAVSDVGRVSSTGISTAIQSLPLGASAIMGSDGWTSALAEVPSIVGGNGLPSVANLASTASSSTMGLNMAEALVQGPARVRTTPQLSVDTQRIEELNRIHYRKLIPVTPSLPKTSVLNSEKTKSKGTRSDFSAPKVGQQCSSSQLVNHTLRSSATRSDDPKTSQAGNLQVLNREKNGICSTAKDGPNLTNASRLVTPLGGAPSAATFPQKKNPVNPKLKTDGKGGGEKKHLSQAQDRNDFFNSLRKKTSAINSSALNSDPICVVPSSSPSNSGGKSGEHLIVTGISAAAAGSCQEKDVIPVVSSSGLKCCLENVNGDTCEEPERLVPDEEEAAFLRSLGWEENAGEEALTAEEIESFVKEYEKLRPSSKLKVVLPEWQQSN